MGYMLLCEQGLRDREQPTARTVHVQLMVDWVKSITSSRAFTYVIPKSELFLLIVLS